MTAHLKIPVTLNVIVHPHVNCNVIRQTIYGRKQKIEYQDKKVGRIGRYTILHISWPECDQNNLYQFILNVFFFFTPNTDWLIDWLSLVIVGSVLDLFHCFIITTFSDIHRYIATGENKAIIVFKPSQYLIHNMLRYIT